MNHKNRSRLLFAIGLIIAGAFIIFLACVAEGQGPETAGTHLCSGGTLLNTESANAIDLQDALTSATTVHLDAHPASWGYHDASVIVYYDLGEVWNIACPDGTTQFVTVSPFIHGGAWHWVVIVGLPDDYHCAAALVMEDWPEYIELDWTGKLHLFDGVQHPLIIPGM